MALEGRERSQQEISETILFHTFTGRKIIMPVEMKMMD